jgi:hypothetical protein
VCLNLIDTYFYDRDGDCGDHDYLDHDYVNGLSGGHYGFDDDGCEPLLLIILP